MSVIPIPVLFVSFVILTLVIVAGLHSRRVADKKKFVLWALLVEYLFLVVCAAVVCRQPFPEPCIHLKPLWVYTDYLNSHPNDAVRDIVVNLLLFIPVGALLAGISPSLKWYHVLLIGAVCSLSIEVSQYVFCRGVAQTDDVIHNAVSCIVGWGVTKIIVGRLNENESK